MAAPSATLPKRGVDIEGRPLAVLAKTADQNERTFRAAVALLVIGVFATRLPFMTRTLYAFDSANYALAVRDRYNVAFHQPHPPGYPLYVAFAWVVNLFTQDANRALILEGIVWSAVAVACTTLVARAFFGRGVGLLAGLLLVCTVGFWGYGEVAYPYVALAGETAAIALLVQRVLSGHRRAVLALAVVWAVSLGTRWDGAIFCVPLCAWALWYVPWRLRLSAVGLALAIVLAWAVPMVMLSGGLDDYRQTVATYLQVWSPQSAYVVGDFASGGETQATYNLNFLINYLRQMLGVGLLLVLYLFGRRFAVAKLASDQRSRFLLVWLVPPLLVYVFAHLGEPGYVLSLAPQAALLAALALFDLRDDVALGVDSLRARRMRWLPRGPIAGAVVSGLLAIAIVSWNLQAFARGVGPGRLPDLRAHDLTTSEQMLFLQQQDPSTTLVMAHDVFRQLAFYVPTMRSELLFSEYVADFQDARTQTPIPQGVERVVILDAIASADPRIQTVSLGGGVTVWVVDVRGARAIEHGYHALSVVS